mmetsp:Transcript_12871/g.24168  ORF Transcript_12871/g.24168 Transcript_12871/m.24168 type:complete len:88 (+) Transcript_12871:166-429(+)
MSVVSYSEPMSEIGTWQWKNLWWKISIRSVPIRVYLRWLVQMHGFVIRQKKNENVWHVSHFQIFDDEVIKRMTRRSCFLAWNTRVDR